VILITLAVVPLPQVWGATPHGVMVTAGLETASLMTCDSAAGAGAQACVMQHVELAPTIEGATGVTTAIAPDSTLSAHPVQ
jgi:hypothetical protein